MQWYNYNGLNWVSKCFVFGQASALFFCYDSFNLYCLSPHPHTEIKLAWKWLLKCSYRGVSKIKKIINMWVGTRDLSVLRPNLVRNGNWCPSKVN